MIKKGDILVAKGNFTVEQTGSDKYPNLNLSEISLTKNKHYKIIWVSVEDSITDEIYFINDLGDRDVFIYEDESELVGGKLDEHNYRNFFYTLKELRKIKLKELLK